MSEITFERLKTLIADYAMQEALFKDTIVAKDREIAVLKSRIAGLENVEPAAETPPPKAKR